MHLLGISSHQNFIVPISHINVPIYGPVINGFLFNLRSTFCCWLGENACKSWLVKYASEPGPGSLVKRWECVMGVPSASPSHILCFTGKKRLVKYVEVLLSTFTNQ